MNPRAFNVLFLCTSNSARSIMAECAMNRWGGERFRGFSAGSYPLDEIHPMTLEVLKELNYDSMARKAADCALGVSRSSPFRRNRRTKAQNFSRNLSADRVPDKAFDPFAS